MPELIDAEQKPLFYAGTIREFLLAFVLLITGLLITLLSWSIVQYNTRTWRSQIFSQETRVIRDRVRERLRLNVAALYAAQGFFAGSVEVTEPEWEEFTKITRIFQISPGIREFSFIERTDEKEQYMVKYRVGLEEGNVVEGESIGANPLYQEALNQARDSAEITFMRQQKFDSKKQEFSLIAPVFSAPSSVNSVAERRDALQGFVVASFDLGQLLGAILEYQDDYPEIAFALYGKLPHQKNQLLIFSSDDGAFTLNKLYKPFFTKQEELLYPGFMLNILFISLPNFGSGFSTDLLPIITVTGGALISFLLFFMFYILLVSRKRAVRYGRKVAMQYEGAKALSGRLERTLVEMPDFVCIADLARNILYINKAGKKMLGFNGKKRGEHLTLDECMPTAALTALVKDVLPRALREGLWEGDTLLLHQEGYEIPVNQLVLAHKNIKGAVEYLSIIARDISNQKNTEETLQKRVAEFEELNRLLVGRELKMVDLKHQLAQQEKKLDIVEKTRKRKDLKNTPKSVT